MNEGPDIAEIFAGAIDMEPAERARYIDRSCGGIEAAKAEVECLLREYDEAEASDFLSKVALEIEAEHFADEEADQRVGQTFGRYKIISKLGTGGMGAIYLAGRTDDFEKQAAVKIIKRGMDTDAILARFRNERQILANLEHPNIARLVDGGTTEDGLPFFVMEYVDGISIRGYCETLNEKQILRLFLKVCSAVSFAHQKLIVHRDLKPSNILVNKEGEPKLLDFGIAKLLDEDNGDLTHTLHRILTPAYASPEQVSGSPVSTASDVYSLGKVLAELLGDDRTRQRIDPDLQKVLSMAMREDVKLRYGSVERFSDDIRRYLDNLPVSARNLSLSYRSRKFFQRNRAKVIFAGLFLVSVTAGLATTIWKANEARRERILAERRFDNLRKLSDSFVTELHAAIQNLPGSLPARQLLLRKATGQLDALAEEAGDNKELQADLATAYFNLSSLPDMEITEKARVLTKADEILEGLLRNYPDNLAYEEQRALTRLELADTRKVEGSVSDGLKYAASAVELLGKVAATEPGDPKHLRNLRDACSSLGGYYLQAGKADEALALARRTFDLSRELNTSQEPSMETKLLESRAHLQLGHVLTVKGDYDAALSELNTALEAETQARTADPNDTSKNYYLWAINRRLAVANHFAGDLPSALTYVNRSLSIIEDLSDLCPTDIGYNRNSAISHLLAGQLLLEQKQNEQALQHFRRALELSEFVMASDPNYLESKIDVARSEGNLGHAFLLAGDRVKGMEMLRASLSTYDEVSGVDVGNAILKRDYAETAGWAAAELENRKDPGAGVFRELSRGLWLDLRSKGELSAADEKLAARQTQLGGDLDRI
jgi:serine/threonine protein kinase